MPYFSRRDFPVNRSQTDLEPHASATATDLLLSRNVEMFERCANVLGWTTPDFTFVRQI
jgi:hypothetical protein